MNNTKIIARCLFILILILFVQPGFCEAVASSSKQRVFDEADLLSEEERAAVQVELEQVSNDLGKEFIIVTQKQLDNISPKVFAENFFDSQGHESGAILLIHMTNRGYYFATLGTAIKDYKSRESYIQSRLKNRLIHEDYYGAFNRFAALMRPPSFFDKFLLAAATWPPYIISLILTLIIVIFLGYNHRGAINVTSNTYAQPNAFQLISSQDHYLRTTTTKTKIQTDDSDDNDSNDSSGGGGDSF